MDRIRKLTEVQPLKGHIHFKLDWSEPGVKSQKRVDRVTLSQRIKNSKTSTVYRMCDLDPPYANRGDVEALRIPEQTFITIRFIYCFRVH
ncbi:hypothetical protein F511_29224 [Dorcoceras hygrometricum]|uniref:Uncharacterized protein n=1 Tax=Dorcoceras hygrometricum TaxID=472368 RepID=A0A2Z7DI74_9LAMI|nr:hypothetical protein F511_29224 [Dorcoceras hygrometricum]